ncbi:2-amino-4-hydroxy-6-hydroxymethyldihydropteridine diphosphokinase [Halosquirtibacter laminarini]|uniref:2-amino-4-hydroxy-6- hydroxymethyldihydropteridine diphosphokinase n=1 Tax=Halosquirtibacter laminarini TaxID=3374600 RepID=UPI0037480777
MNKVIISLGSNISPDHNIPSAILLLSLKHRLLDITKVEITDPIGIEDQSKFHNAALLVETWFSQDAFNTFLKEIEDTLLRDRSAPKFGPRTIDLDIVVWNGNIVDNDYYKRDFLKRHTDMLLNN